MEQHTLESALTNVMEMAQLGFWELDCVKGLFTLSDLFYTLFHTSAAVVGGYSITEAEYYQRFVHPDDIDSVRSEMHRAIASKELTTRLELEHRFLDADGALGHVVLRYVSITTAEGQTVKICGVAQNISELKEVEKQLRVITESARDAILMMDPRGRISYWNVAAEHILGYSAPEALGKNLHQLIAPDRYHAAHFSAFSAFLDSGHGNAVGKTLELYAQRKDGQEIPVELSLSTVSLHAQWHAVGILRDISDRKKVEEALRDSEKRFRDLIEMLPETVFETDQQLNLIFVNRPAFAMFGYSPSDFEKGLKAWEMIAPQDLEVASENITKIFQGHPMGAEEYRGLRKDGSTFPMLVHANPILSQGSVTGLRGIIVDISDRKKTQEQLLQDQKMKSIGTLAGGIAHDFNNILQPMLGYSELLRQDLPNDSPQQRYVEGIYNSGLRAKELVNQILTFSRQTEHEKIPIRIQSILKEVIKLSRSTIPSNIAISQTIEKECASVMADPTQLHQIAMNLIINAYHAVETIGGKISVNLKETTVGPTDSEELGLHSGRYALLSVADTGSGIDPTLMDKIFEPYFTTKAQGKGTGLGLSVVYGIVKDHQGDIKVESQLGKGTTVNVYLPLTDELTKTRTSAKRENFPTGNEHILLVDDEEIIAELGKLMLEQLGYRVSTRLSSVDALEAFKANPRAYDLVISDMTMPNMTGDQLTQALLAIDPRIPIIICTGFSERVDSEKAASIGAKAYLLKPITMSEMSHKVRNVLDGCLKVT